MLANLLNDWPFLIIVTGSTYGLFVYHKLANRTKTGDVNWTPFESVCVTLTIYFGGQFGGALIVFLPALLAGVSPERFSDWADKSVYGQFLVITFVEFFSVWLVYKFVKKSGASLKSIGLKPAKLRDIGFVLMGFGAYFIVYLFALAIVRAAVPSLNVDQKQVIGFDGANGLQLPFVFVSLVLLPPVAEEVIMRGFLYSGLRKKLRFIWAATATSVLFGIAHLQFGSGQPLLWTAAIDTFVLSFVLVYLRERTGSLAAPIGLHMLKNFIAFMSLFVFHIV